MVEVRGDVWDYYDQGYWLVVTTNGSLNRRGEPGSRSRPRSGIQNYPSYSAGSYARVANRPPVAMVRPGCGNGWLDWEEVKHLIEPVLSTDRYLIVDDGSGKATKDLHRRRLAKRMEAGV